MKTKPMRRVCAGCKKELTPVMVGGNMHEDFVMLALCEDCYEEPEPERDLDDENRQADLKIMAAAARGHSLDANGNPIQAVMVLQNGFDYEVHEYEIDPLTDLLRERAK